jgi:hypothetical protein
MGEGRELNSSFDWPSFWLKQQKTVQLSHWQLQSAHFTTDIENDPAAENQPQTKGTHMQAIINLETGSPAIALTGSQKLDVSPTGQET